MPGFWGIGGRISLSLPKEGRTSFLKKRSKKLLDFVGVLVEPSGPNDQKFFGSFFQKRTFFLSSRA
jgi:hypothetical protein